MSELSELDWDVRSRIYRSFTESGQAPALAALAAAVGSTEHQMRESLARLFDAHEIAPTPDGGSIWMANPFSAVPTDFVVETPSMTCYAACAWDAFGVPAVLEADGRVRTHCAGSGLPLEFGIEDGALVGDVGVVHLVTPIGDAWVDIGFT